MEFRWLPQLCEGLVCVRAMPGHGVTFRVGAAAAGEPRGAIQRCNVSMMIMRPPQQGKGGRGSAGSGGSAGAAGGAATSSALARARLA